MTTHAPAALNYDNGHIIILIRSNDLSRFKKVFEDVEIGMECLLAKSHLGCK
jgi:hypothetical protein